KSKKSRDGGAAAWARGSAWALKGGNTQEFWRWTAATGTWTELDTMPALGSSGRRKRVKNGGDIVAWSEGVFFALKGNKTNELWRYVAPAGALSPGSPLRSGAQSGGAATTVAGRRLSIAVPAGGPVSVRVFDASGRLVLRARVVRPQTAAVDLGGLRAGVYMVRLDWGTAGSTQRVVVH
ncbi:T9SS type A sorting domain-containing protein, partial [candidate division WOR-3 bacterium]|nr:T9SS type A sorting domain-containing protein [candidate division WOR-3 bacterium]